MNIDVKNLKEIIRARISRTIIYLQRFIKELPKYLLHLRHKFDHPLSELHILTQQLSPYPKLDPLRAHPLPEGGIPEDISYFEMALNEIKTALLYLKQREIGLVFQEIRDYYLEQKIAKIIKTLEEIAEELSS